MQGIVFGWYRVVATQLTQGAECASPPCKSIFQPPAPDLKTNYKNNTGNYAPTQPLENFFDLCHACYDKGATCQNPSSHQLTLYFSYDTPKHLKAVYNEPNVSCDVCKAEIKDEECYREFFASSPSRLSAPLLPLFLVLDPSQNHPVHTHQSRHVCHSICIFHNLLTLCRYSRKQTVPPVKITTTIFAQPAT